MDKVFNGFNANVHHLDRLIRLLLLNPFLRSKPSGRSYAASHSFHLSITVPDRNVLATKLRYPINNRFFFQLFTTTIIYLISYASF